MAVFYYWVTWAPLTRGSAATGYVFLYGLLLASNVVVRNGPPVDFQADWEAILRSSCTEFVEHVCEMWLLKKEETTGNGTGTGTGECCEWNETILNDVPLVKEKVTTLRHMIQMLNVDI